MSPAPVRSAGVAADPVCRMADHDLPARWQGRARFAILALRFGSGCDFLSVWQAWRDDPLRSERLVFIAIEPAPLAGAELALAHQGHASPRLAAALHRAWPPCAANLHRLAFDDDRVELLLAIGTVRACLPELVAEVDAFCLSDASAVASASMPRIGKALARLAAPGATLTMTGAEAALRAGLAAAGFVVDAEAARGGVEHARYAPAFTARAAPSRRRVDSHAAPHAIVIGAGLAGCSAAAALAVHGWHSTVLERHAEPAGDASGNPAGLFHGIVNANDGVHARFNRAAALAARAAVQAAIEHGVPGAASGLLRLETTLAAPQMRAQLQQLRLPPEYVQALDADEASARAGIRLQSPCWFYPGGGWVQPGGLARSWLAQAGAQTELRTGLTVDTLHRTASGWCALDARGSVIAEASTVVVANAADALRLLDTAPHFDDSLRADTGGWPIDRVRGQISLAPASRLESPTLPIAGSGYLLPEFEGRAMFGATSQVGDVDPAVRARDHLLNLAQLERLTGRRSDLTPTDLQGRTAWRCSAADRLPIIGAVPATGGMGRPHDRLDQPRFVPRVPGLFVFGALGARGITWSALGGQVLASWVTGAPAPLEARLLDAIDPARFVSRRVRRASRG